MIVGGLLFGDWVISFLYGSKFPGAPIIFKIHIFACLPIFWGTAWGIWMMTIQQQKYILWMQLLSAVIILGCEFLFIPRLGIQGAALSAVSGAYVSFIFMILAYQPLKGLKVFIQAANPKNLLEVVKYWKG